MRRILAIVLLLTLIPVAGASEAEARPRRTLVTKDCLHLGARPSSIVFACADGGFLVRRLEWRSWHRRSAFAHGVFHQNDCDPNCAGGTFHRMTGTLRLTHRRWCARWHRHVFRHALVVFDAPLLGRDRQSFAMFCPLRRPG
jgi:hypothetical protein